MRGHIKSVLEGVVVYIIVVTGIFQYLDRVKLTERLPPWVVPLVWVAGPCVMVVMSLIIRPIPQASASASVLQHVWAETRRLAATFVILAAMGLANQLWLRPRPGSAQGAGTGQASPPDSMATPADTPRPLSVPPWPAPPSPDSDSLLDSHFTRSPDPLAFVDSGSVQALRLRDWHGHVLTVLRYGQGRFFLAGRDLVRGVPLPELTGQQLEAMVTRFRSTLMDHAIASLRNALASGAARVMRDGPDRYQVDWGNFSFFAGCAVDGDLLDELTMWEDNELKLELNGRSPAGDRSFIGTEGLASALRHAAH